MGSSRGFELALGFALLGLLAVAPPAAAANDVDVSLALRAEENSGCHVWPRTGQVSWNLTIAMNGTNATPITTPTYVWVNASTIPAMSDGWTFVLAASQPSPGPEAYDAATSNEFAAFSAVFSPATSLDLALYPVADVPPRPAANITVLLTPTLPTRTQTWTFNITATTHRSGSPQVDRSVELCVVVPALPSVTIYQPIEGPTWVNVQSINVAGVVDPPNSTVWVNGVSSTPAADGTFTASYPLVEGLNNITVTAVDFLGVNASDWSLVWRDTVPPSLILSSPLEEDTLTNQAAWPIRGVVESSATQLALNGLSIAFAADGSFQYNYSLSDGLNLLRFVAADQAGNQVVVARTITYDRYPPFLQVNSPVNGLLTNGLHLNVSGRTERDATVTVNAVPAFVDPINGDFFLDNVTLDDLFDQTANILVIKAVDRAGNIRFENRTVVVDTRAPAILLNLDPAVAAAVVNGQTIRLTAVEVRGTVDDDRAIVAVAGQEVPLSGLNFSRTLVLREGLNIIYITAQDLAGNVGTLTLQLRVDLSIPTILLLSPAMTQIITNSTTLQILGRTDSPDATASIEYEDLFGVRVTDHAPIVDGADPGTYEFSFLLTLNPDGAPHVVNIRVVDLAGNTGVDTFVYTCLVHEPSLHLDVHPPPRGASFVWVNGTTQVGIDSVEINGQSFDVVDQFFAVRLNLFNWGASTITVRIVDAAGNENIQTIVVETAATHDPVSIDIGGRRDGTAEAGVATTLSLVNAPIPDDAQVLWFLDGNPLGTGRRLDQVMLPAGEHNLTVTLHNSTWHASHTESIHASASLATAVGGSSMLLLSLGLIGLAGAVLGGTEMGRYFVVFAALGAVLRRGKPASPLDHFVRGRLYQIISEEPGIHYSELRRRAKLSNGSATHHLHVLDRAGLIRVMLDGTKTRFFPTDRPLDDESYGLTEGDRAVLSAVTTAPGLSEGEISQRLERHISVVSRSVDRLGALGLVTTQQDGRQVSVFPRAGAEMPGPPPWPGEGE